MNSTDSDLGVYFKLEVFLQAECSDKVTVQVAVLSVLVAVQHIRPTVLLKEAKPRSEIPLIRKGTISRLCLCRF